jgi:hypothetical protein
MGLPSVTLKSARRRQVMSAVPQLEPTAVRELRREGFVGTKAQCNQVGLKPKPFTDQVPGPADAPQMARRRLKWPVGAGSATRRSTARGS